MEKMARHKSGHHMSRETHTVEKSSFRELGSYNPSIHYNIINIVSQCSLLHWTASLHCSWAQARATANSHISIDSPNYSWHVSDGLYLPMPFCLSLSSCGPLHRLTVMFPQMKDSLIIFSLGICWLCITQSIYSDRLSFTNTLFCSLLIANHPLPIIGHTRNLWLG